MVPSFISFLELASDTSIKYQDKLYDKGIGMLYHYTDLPGLLGILQTRGFWASNYNFLNDKKEFFHGIEICNQIINEQNTHQLPLAGKKYLDGLRELINSDDQDIFIVSFCSKPDLLSQWRGYSGGQQGVSIGFDYRELIQYSTKRDNEYFIVQKVIYDKDIQKEILREIIEKGLEVVVEHNILDDFQTKEVNMAIKRFIALFKDDSFQEESEWRRVTINFKGSSEKLTPKFRVRSNYILPYVEIPLFYRQSEELNLPIKEVVVAPPSSSTTLKSLEYMFNEKGYLDVRVKASYIPYR